MVERDRLQEASRNYGLAMSSYCDRYVSALIEGEKVPRPELDPSVEQRIERFKSIGGFAKGWQRFVQNAASLRDVLATSEAGEAGESDGDVRNGTSLTVGDRAIMQNRLRTNLDRMNSKMENTLMTYFLSRDDPQRQRSSLGLIDCLTPLREHRLNAGRFKNFPAVAVRSDFDDCHTTTNNLRLPRGPRIRLCRRMVFGKILARLTA